MKVKLLKEARIRHKAGDIVEVSPAEADFLLSLRVGERVQEAGTAAKSPEKPARRKKEA